MASQPQLNVPVGRIILKHMRTYFAATLRGAIRGAMLLSRQCTALAAPLRQVQPIPQAGSEAALPCCSCCRDSWAFQGVREAYRHKEFWPLIACSSGGGNGSAAQDTSSADTLAPCRVGLLTRSLHCSLSRVLGRASLMMTQHSERAVVHV